MWIKPLVRACGLWAVTMSVATSAVAADHPIEAIPDSVGVVVRLKQPQQTIDKLTKFVENVEPAMAQQVQQLSAMSGILISNPAQAGVDKTGDWWVAVFIEGEDQPKVVFAVPTTDADALKQAVGAQFHFATYENWALYSKDNETVKRIESRISGEGESISGKVDEKTIEAFHAGDVALYVNVDHLAEVYRDKLDEAESQIDTLIDQISSMTPPSAGVNAEAIWDMYGKLAHGLVRAVRDTKALTVTLAFNPENLLIEEYVATKSGTPSAEFLAGNPGSPMKLMEKLPADKPIYYGFHGDMAELMELGMNMSKKMLKEQDPEITKAFEDMQKAYSQLKFGDVAGMFSLGDLQNGVIRTTTVMEVSPAGKMREIVRNVLPAISKVEVQGFKQTVEIQKDAEKYGKHSADIVTTRQEVDPDLDPTGMQGKLVELMHGPDGMVARYVYTDKVMVQAIGHGREGMEQALAALEGTGTSHAGEQEAFQTVRAQIGQNVNLAALVDIPRLAVEAGKIVARSGEFPVPFTAESLDELEIQPSYVGFSIATEAHNLRCKTSITAQQVKGIVSIVKFAQTSQQRGRL